MKKVLSILLIMCLLAGAGAVSVLADVYVCTLALNTPRTISDEDRLYSDFGDWIYFRHKPSASGTYAVRVEGNFDSLEFVLGNSLMNATTEVFDGLSGSWSGNYSMTAEEYFRFLIKCETDDHFTVTITEAGQTTPESKWWETLPNFLQWILRYILFGWLWMNWF